MKKKTKKPAVKNDWLLADGNNKICTGVGVWTLPARITCPGATSLCKNGMTCNVPGGKKTRIVKCYAVKAEKAYPNCLPCRKGHMAITQTPEFITHMVEEIKARKFELVRWQESGDIYSQTYLDALYSVCRQTPDVKHWLYTKSYALFNFEGKPDNLVIYLSVDRTTPADWRETLCPSLADAPTAYLRCPDEPIPSDAITCDKGGLDKGYCMKTCQKCLAGVNVYFDAH